MRRVLWPLCLFCDISATRFFSALPQVRKLKKNEFSPLSLVGYAALQLYRDGRIVGNLNGALKVQ